jgi:hypothetical protein
MYKECCPKKKHLLTLAEEAVAKLFTYALSCWSHTRIDAVLFTAVPSRGVDSWLVVAMLRRKLLCDVIVFSPPGHKFKTRF